MLRNMPRMIWPVNDRVGILTDFFKLRVHALNCFIKGLWLPAVLTKINCRMGAFRETQW